MTVRLLTLGEQDTFMSLFASSIRISLTIIVPVECTDPEEKRNRKFGIPTGLTFFNESQMISKSYYNEKNKMKIVKRKFEI